MDGTAEDFEKLDAFRYERDASIWGFTEPKSIGYRELASMNRNLYIQEEHLSL